MANYINILADACLYASGVLLPRGTLTVTAVDGNGRPLAFTIGGGGLSTLDSISRPIVNGSMVGTLSLPDPAATSPPNIGYTFSITDLSTYSQTVFERVAITADSNGDFDLATLEASTYATAVPVIYVTGPTGETGPQGPPGPTGAAGFGVLTDTVTSVEYTVTIANGVLVPVPVSASVIVYDAGQSQNYSIALKYGSLTWTPIGQAGTLSTTATLIDTVTSNHYTLTVDDGEFETVPAAVSVSGVASLLVVDLGTGHSYSLYISEAQLRWAPL